MTDWNEFVQARIPTNTKFASWMKHVDRIVTRKWGMGVADLPDLNFRDWYDAGMTSREAAYESRNCVIRTWIDGGDLPDDED